MNEITRNMKHGDKCVCRTCGTSGRKDDMKIEGNTAEFDDAIWFVGDDVTECHECWLK